jgi:hypothetical protein
MSEMQGKLNDLHSRHVVIGNKGNIFHRKYVGASMTYLEINFHMSDSYG